MAKISVVTRAYNVESYIMQCVNSVLAQTLEDFEYFIINNGSTDKTQQILTELSKGDKRITLIDIPKNDVGISAVETLIERGTGEYFTALDSDDWIEPDMFEKLYESAILYGAQISVGGQILFSQKENTESIRYFSLAKVINRDMFPEYFSYYHSLFRPLWGKLFSAELIREKWQDIKKSRPSYLHYGGDTYTCMELLRWTDKISFVSKGLYHYRVNDKSSSYIYYKARFSSDLFLLEQAKEFLSIFGDISTENMRFLSEVYTNAIIDTSMILLKCDMNTTKKLSELSRIYNHPQTENIIQIVFDLEQLEKMRITICKICSQIYKTLGDDKIITSLMYSILCGINPYLKGYLPNKALVPLLREQTLLESVINAGGVPIEIKSHYFFVCHSEDFIKRYFSLCLDVYFENYNKALNQLVRFLNKKGIEYEEELIELALNVAAYLEESDMFITAKKHQAYYYLRHKNLEKSQEIITDLKDMMIEDRVIEKLINIYNAEQNIRK